MIPPHCISGATWEGGYGGLAPSKIISLIDLDIGPLWVILNK